MPGRSWRATGLGGHRCKRKTPFMKEHNDINADTGHRPGTTACAVLYLDFDGVLHHEDVRRRKKRGVYFGADATAHGKHHGHDHTLHEHAPLLSELLAPYPQVRIVLSTTWTQWRGYEHARRRLPPELAERCIGSTYHSRMNLERFRALPRGQQICADVARRQPSAWLALDDDSVGWPEWCRDKLIRTDDALGIGAPHVREELANKFAATFGRDAGI
jgi:hypothetical protein